MDYPRVVSRDEWLVARKQLLAKEKDFTRHRDELNAERRRLPMVKIEKDYNFLLVGTYHYLNLTALGRQEDWEKARGRSNSHSWHGCVIMTSKATRFGDHHLWRRG